MNDTPTPETDAECRRTGHEDAPASYLRADFARQMERELAAARERADINGRDWRRQFLKSEDLRSERDTLSDLLHEAYVFLGMRHKELSPWRIALDEWQAKVESKTGWTHFAKVEKFENTGS